MQAVIFARGKGVRQRPLTWTRPKVLLPLGGKTILEHTLEILNGLAEEAILVIDPRQESIFLQKIGNQFRQLKIKYAYQEKALGTGDALRQAQSYLQERFLVLNGDDLYQREDLEKVLKKFPSLLVQEVENPSAFGVVSIEKGAVKDFIEKPKGDINHLANAGLYFLDQGIFKEKLEMSERGELELTQAIGSLAKKIPLWAVKTKNWLPLSYPWDLLQANQLLLARQKGKRRGVKLEKGVRIKGKVVLEPGVMVKSGSYLEGPLWIGAGSQIGSQAYLRPATMIAAHCRIGAGVEIKNSIIGEGTQISHLSYIGDSVIGSHCLLGAGTITANLRFDQKSIRAEVKGEIIDTGRRKFGAVLGDKVKVGVHSSFMPGVLIDPEVVIEPHSLVKKNIKNSHLN